MSSLVLCIYTNSSPSSETLNSSNTKKVAVHSSGVDALLNVVKPKSFVAASDGGSDPLPSVLCSQKEFWRLLHAALTDDAMVSFDIEFNNKDDIESVKSSLVMAGFLVQDFVQGAKFTRLTARKPVFKSGGISIKKTAKKEEAENPWGALSN